MKSSKELYGGKNKGLTTSKHGMRAPGRPSKAMANYRRWYNRKRFIERFGVDIHDVLKQKGYVMARKSKNSPVRVKELVVREDGTAVVHQNAFLNIEAEEMLINIVKNLLRGVEVPGFALIPENKVVGNTTVEKVIVPVFPKGHPAYRMALVTVQAKYAS